jgi:hypothetical protein
MGKSFHHLVPCKAPKCAEKDLPEDEDLDQPKTRQTVTLRNILRDFLGDAL